MKGRYRKFTELMDEMLEDPEFAAEFLSEALEHEDFETFLLSLKDVIRAHGSISEFARKTELSRSTVYSLFSPDANPEMRTLLHVLHALGYDLKIIHKAA